MNRRRLIISFVLYTITFCWNTSLFSQIDSTNLPLVIIDTGGQPIIDEPKIEAHLKIIYNETTDRINTLRKYMVLFNVYVPINIFDYRCPGEIISPS